MRPWQGYFFKPWKSEAVEVLSLLSHTGGKGLGPDRFFLERHVFLERWQVAAMDLVCCCRPL